VFVLQLIQLLPEVPRLSPDHYIDSFNILNWNLKYLEH
jgi:hypothetical protein